MDETRRQAELTLLKVKALLASWGWVQHHSVTEDGYDLIGAVEAVSGLRLAGLTVEEDAVLDPFLPALNLALRTLAAVLPPRPDEDALPDQRWAWIHAITTFNDDGNTDEHHVQRALRMAVDALHR